MNVIGFVARKHFSNGPNSKQKTGRIAIYFVCLVSRFFWWLIHIVRDDSNNGPHA